MSFQAPRALPAGVSLSVFVSFKGAVATITNENGDLLTTVFGYGANSDEARASATERYFAEAFDHRTGSHIKGKVWVHKDGVKARVEASDEAGMIADGWIKGRGPNAPKEVAATAA